MSRELAKLQIESWHLLDQFPRGGDQLLHSDLGFHNLYWTSAGELIALDPAGACGPQSYEAAIAAFWGHGDPCGALTRVRRLAGLLGFDELEMIAWAAIRAAISGGFRAGQGRETGPTVSAGYELLRAL